MQLYRSAHTVREAAGLTELTHDAIVLQGRQTAQSLAVLRGSLAFVLVSSFVVSVIYVALTQRGISPVALAAMAVFYPLVYFTLQARLRQICRRIDERSIPLTLRVDPSGVWVQDSFGVHGPIPWEAIESVETSRFLSPQIVLRLKDRALAKKALGGKYWLFRIPGGLGVRSDLFGMEPEELAERITRYRQRGLGG